MQIWGILDLRPSLRCKNHFFLNPPPTFVLEHHLFVEPPCFPEFFGWRRRAQRFTGRCLFRVLITHNMVPVDMHVIMVINALLYYQEFRYMVIQL